MNYSIISSYFLFISILTFIMFGIDKRRSQRKKWRIPEKQLLLVAILGGSAGGLCGMYWFNHKTRHAKFTLGIPFILLIQIIILSNIYFR